MISQVNGERARLLREIDIAEKVYKNRLREIDIELCELQKKCNHSDQYYCPDPSGNNDSSYYCPNCGKESRRRL